MTPGAAASDARLGRYLLGESLGGGPTGEVYAARLASATASARPLALKKFHQGLVARVEAASSLVSAARSYSTLEHPRIARLIEYGVADGITFTVVELVDGVDCARLMAAGTLPQGAAAALTVQASRAVAFAHGRGLVHNGVCPTNLIVSSSGDLKVTDFGILAPRLPERPADDPALAARIPYLAPEQLVGQAVSPATDVFQLGVVGYELLTGRKPFAGPNPVEIAQQILSAPPAESGLSKPLSQALRRALARSPFERFPDARSFAEAIEAAVRQAPVPGDRRDAANLVKRAQAADEDRGTGPRRAPTDLPALPRAPSSPGAARAAPAPAPASPAVPAVPNVPTPSSPAGRSSGAEEPPTIRRPPLQVSELQVPDPRRTLSGVGGAKNAGEPGRTPAPALRKIPTIIGRPETSPPAAARAQKADLRGPADTLESATDFAGDRGSIPGDFGGSATVDMPTLPGESADVDLGELIDSSVADFTGDAGGETGTGAEIGFDDPTRTDVETNPGPTKVAPRSGQHTDAAIPEAAADQVAAGDSRITDQGLPSPPTPAPRLPEPRRPPTPRADPAPPLRFKNPATNAKTPLPEPVPGLGADNESSGLHSGFEPPLLALPDPAEPQASDTGSQAGSELPLPSAQNTPPPAASFAPGPAQGADGHLLPPRAPAKRSSRALLYVFLFVALAAGSFVAYNMFLSQDEGEAVAFDGAVAEQPVDAATLAAAGKGDAGAAAAPATPDAATAVAGDLEITTKPKRAKIYLDGSSIGKSPQTIEDVADTHTLAIVLPGYKLYTQEITGGGSLDIDLEEVTPTGGPAGIKVRCRKKNRYYVFVDGEDTGQLCPTERIGVELGKHVVEIYDPVTDSRRVFNAHVKETRLSLRVRVD